MQLSQISRTLGLRHFVRSRGIAVHVDGAKVFRATIRRTK